MTETLALLPRSERIAVVTDTNGDTLAIMRNEDGEEFAVVLD
jgi:hypothetical protein